jgi:hypothetical protein
VLYLHQLIYAQDIHILVADEQSNDLFLGDSKSLCACLGDETEQTGPVSANAGIPELIEFVVDEFQFVKSEHKVKFIIV